MAYTIKNTDGTTLLLLSDGKIDSNSTSLTLVGKNYLSYGEIWNNNLIKLLGNFSNFTSPSSPLNGQLWYDSLNKKLNLYDETDGWEPLNGAQISNSEPATMSSGDLWWDSFNNQLYIKLDSGISLVGPNFSSNIGQNGWVLPTNSIQDNTNGTSGNVKQVTLLRNYGQTLGYVANEKFTIATTSTNAYITTATTSTVRGLTIIGDIRASDTAYANTLTVASTIVYPKSERVGTPEELDFWVQINNIAVRVFNTGPSFRPEIRAVSGTASISFAGYTVKVGSPILAISQSLTNLTTTPLAMVPGPSEFSGVGDMLEVILTDQTINTEEGIRTYRITVQIATISPVTRASVHLEKLV
jgi:hypothetical protein